MAQYGLKLPAQNRLLPEQFELADAPSQPELVVDEEGLSVWLRGSEAFADLPRGYTQVYLNSPLRQASVRLLSCSYCGLTYTTWSRPR